MSNNLKKITPPLEQSDEDSVDNSVQKNREKQILGQDRLTSLGLLTEGLAHELGTPLGVARGRAEYLIGFTPENSTVRKGLVTIVEQIDRVSKLMEALQNLSAPKNTEVTAPVAVAKMVASVQRLIEGRLAENNIQFTTAIPEGVSVNAESSKLGQVLLSLCINSYQALSDRKKIAPPLEGYMKLSASDKGEFWEISLEDNGGGIHPNDVPHLFKPFFTTKEVGVGTGLGLASANQVVHHWGGRIEVDNRPGYGVTFRILLPKAQNMTTEGEE